MVRLIKTRISERIINERTTPTPVPALIGFRYRPSQLSAPWELFKMQILYMSISQYWVGLYIRYLKISEQRFMNI